MEVYIKIGKKEMWVMKNNTFNYKSVVISKAFTTEAKIPKKRGNWRSIENAKAFMYWMFTRNLQKCRYETLVWSFVNFFGTNDKRTVERYLGRPEQTIHSSGTTSMVRLNRTSGKTAQFQYFNTKRIPGKKGLLDILNWITKLKDKDNTVLIHHEVMDYYTKQITLQEPEIFYKNDESLEASKDNVCVSSLYEKEDRGILQGKEFEKTVLEVVSTPNIETKEKKKEEEVIDSTHTCIIGVNYASKHTRYALTPEEEAILTAKPCEEPDRAKIRWNSDE